MYWILYRLFPVSGGITPVASAGTVDGEQGAILQYYYSIFLLVIPQVCCKHSVDNDQPDRSGFQRRARDTWDTRTGIQVSCFCHWILITWLLYHLSPVLDYLKPTTRETLLHLCTAVRMDLFHRATITDNDYSASCRFSASSSMCDPRILTYSVRQLPGVFLSKEI